MDWRAALLLVGLLGVPVVGAILLQSRVLHDQPKPRRQEATGPTGRALLLSRPMLLFFAFFLLSAMAGSGVQAWLVTVLGKLWGTPVLVASSALTGYMVGATAGTLVGGWIADRTRRGLLGTVVAADRRPPWRCCCCRGSWRCRTRCFRRWRCWPAWRSAPRARRAT